MQLPPPIHGASVVNDFVARSEVLSKQFAIDVLPLQFAGSVADVGKASLDKVVRGCTTAVQLFVRLARTRPDALYLTLSPAGLAFYRDCVFIALAKVFDVPRIYHLHAKGVATRTSSVWSRRLYAWAFRDARVIQLSALLARDLADVVEAGQLAFVANGVPDEGGCERDVDARRGQPLRVLYLSNMIETKGPMVLLEALHLLASRGVDVEATFAGATADEGFLTLFLARIVALGLAGRARYVGPAYGKTKAELFRDHDIFVLPTYYPLECFPLVLLEAMQWSLPVVSTREGAIPDIVEHERTGLLVTRPDVSEIADAIHQLAEDPARRSQMGRAARARYLESFTLLKFEERLAEVLAAALDTARRGT